MSMISRFCSFMKRIVFIAAAFLSLSCVHEHMTDEADSGDGKVEVSLKTVVRNGHGEETRSVLPEEDIEVKVTDLTLASYDEKGNLVDVVYHTDLSDVRIFIDAEGQNDLYALANMGNMADAMPQRVDNVGEVDYEITSYEDVGLNGIPMCAHMTVTASDDEPVIMLERLFAKINLRILHTSLTASNTPTDYAYNLCNKSVYIRQANRKLYPFASSGSRALSQDDILAESDCNPDLNDKTVHKDMSGFGPGPGYWKDTTVVMYVPENMQGMLLPANDDPFAKVEESIKEVNGRDYSGLCTYVELNAWKESIGTGVSGSVMYRFYLGADNVKDFNIRRNGCYNVTLDLTQDSFGMDNWKVVKGDDWTDTRSLAFLDDSYVVYAGSTQRVFVHFSTSEGPGYDSQVRPSEWTYSFDKDGMSAAGLTYTYNPTQLLYSTAGAKDISFLFTASETASVGTAFPLTVSLKDGSVTDHAMIYVAKAGDITLNWDNMPLYVAQYGEVTLEGLSDASFPLAVTVSDPSVLSCVHTGNDSFRIVAMRPGETDITFTGKDGSQTYTAHMKISAPVLDLTTSAVALNPDGGGVRIGYDYLDARGEVISGFDEDAFEEYLLPVVSDAGYFSTSMESGRLEIMIDRLYDADGKQIDMGALYDLTIKAADCDEVVPRDMQAYVVDPFDDIEPVHYGRIDDYSLFEDADVPVRLKTHFKDEMSANKSFEYVAPSPLANSAYVQAGLVPEWRQNFSNENGMYSIVYNAGAFDSSTGSSFTVRQNAFNSSLAHSAGRHDVMLYVVNRHSQEKIGHVCGYIDVYVHTALGARARFGNKAADYRPDGASASSACFADVYNSLAGTSLFSGASAKKIYYIDVYAEFLTDVSKVYVPDKLIVYAKAGSDVFNAVSMLQPGVADGKADPNTRMLYSVNGTDGDRINIGAEEYGRRKGIGVMLYRALRMQTYDSDVTDTDLYGWFLGVDMNGVAGRTFAPRLEVHDLMKGNDMSLNIVPHDDPYYFAPSDHPSKVDQDGKGYHVIHFLEDIEPDTGGWINLL